MQPILRMRPLVNPILSNQKRNLFRWLVVVFNKFDERQIKELGPQVAAAQWLVRNGASVRWSKSAGPFNDYDKLISDSSLKQDSIVEIDATNSGINHLGFPYLQNLKSLQKIIFNETEHLDDRALILLGKYELPNLKHLEIIKCHDVKDNGVLALKTLKTLDYLKLQGLSSVDNMKNCVDVLSKELPECKIEWK